MSIERWCSPGEESSNPTVAGYLEGQTLRLARIQQELAGSRIQKHGR